MPSLVTRRRRQQAAAEKEDAIEMGGRKVNAAVAEPQGSLTEVILQYAGLPIVALIFLIYLFFIRGK